MLVDVDNEFIFLKPQKCAGTSVEGYLRQFTSRKAFGVPFKESEESVLREAGVGPIARRRVPIRLWARNDIKLAGNKFNPRSGLPLFQTHQSAESVYLYLGERTFNRLQKVSIARNPFDRMVSWFFWRNRYKATIAESEVLRESFHRFVVNSICGLSRQAQSVTHIGRRSAIDKWLKFENLATELDEFSKSLSSPRREHLPLSFFRFKSFSNTSRPTTAFLFSENEAIVQLVVHHFRWDFEFHGYPRCPQEIPTEFGDVSS